MSFQQAQWEGFVASVQFLMDKSPHYKKQHTTGSNWYSFGTQQRSEVLNEHEEWTNLSPPSYSRSGMRHLIEPHRKLGLLLSVPPYAILKQRPSFLTNTGLTLLMNSKFMWKIWRLWKSVFNLRILPKEYKLLHHGKSSFSWLPAALKTITLIPCYTYAYVKHMYMLSRSKCISYSCMCVHNRSNVFS